MLFELSFRFNGVPFSDCGSELVATDCLENRNFENLLLGKTELKKTKTGTKLK